MPSGIIEVVQVIHPGDQLDKWSVVRPGLINKRFTVGYGKDVITVNPHSPVCAWPSAISSALI
jgi:hypothetical protein